MNYALHLLIYLSVYVMLAVSLNLVVGYCGLLTFAHAGYFGLGAYAYAILSLKLGWGMLPTVLFAFLVPAVLSLAVSLPSWRLKGDFFVMATLAVQTLLFSAIHNWHTPDSGIGTWANLTNGPFGIAGIPKPAIAGIRLDTIGAIALLSVLMAAICSALFALLLSSPWGRVLQAMRDDELAARGLGKNVRLLKAQAFLIACGTAGVAGAIYASYVGYVSPSVASLDESILVLCMVVVGGVGNFRGPLVGAAILLAVPEALRFAQIPGNVAAEVRIMAFGLLLVLLMHFRPQGLAGRYRIE